MNCSRRSFIKIGFLTALSSFLLYPKLKITAQKLFNTDDPAFISPDECTSCGACVPKCPTDAISEDLQLSTYIVDQTKCDGEICGYRCFEICPADAICKRSLVNNGSCPK